MTMVITVIILVMTMITMLMMTVIVIWWWWLWSDDDGDIAPDEDKPTAHAESSLNEVCGLLKEVRDWRSRQVLEIQMFIPSLMMLLLMQSAGHLNNLKWNIWKLPCRQSPCNRFPAWQTLLGPSSHPAKWSLLLLLGRYCYCWVVILNQHHNHHNCQIIWHHYR